MTTPVVMVAIPAVWWGRERAPNPELAVTAHEALDIERRLRKGVDRARERLRYNACCRSIESFARRRFTFVSAREEFNAQLVENRIPAFRIEPDYLPFLSGLLDSFKPESPDARLAASFFPLALIGPHLEALESAIRYGPGTPPASATRRLEFLRWAYETHCGVVEFPDPYAGESAVAVLQAQPRPQRIEIPHLEVPPPPEGPPEEEEAEGEIPVSEWVLMRREVEIALQSGLGVTFSNYHHPVIAGILRELAYREIDDGPIPLRVLYGDGSEADPFPVGGLKLDQRKRKEAEATPPLRAALLSIRHPEMDGEVDLAWFANYGASRPRESAADTDRWCFEQSVKLFEDFPPGRLTVIEVYQTGFEPAVVGFYRAVTTVLSDHTARLAVRPRIFRGQGIYVPGDWWC